MENYLMSSPSQHHHPYQQPHQQHNPYANSDTLTNLPNLENDLDFSDSEVVPPSKDYSGSPNVYDGLDFSTDMATDFVYDSTLEFDLDDHKHMPDPAEMGHSKHFSVDRPLSAPFYLSQNSRTNFNHSRNISLDDTAYKRSFHKHSASLVSNAAEPPSGTFAHSHSSNTLQSSSDSMPQLSSSVSNPSLLDSPHSAMQTATPGRRHKSSSVSSHTNLYTTPLRGGTHVSPLTHTKVGKTPIGKTHRRNRSRASLEPSSAHLLATVANMKGTSNASNLALSSAQTPSGHLTASTSQHFHGINLSEANPFHNEFVSPGVGSGHLSDHDATPLNTPAGRDHSSMASQFFTPISHNRSFGGSLLESSSSAMGSAASAFPSNLSSNDLSVASSSNSSARPGMAPLRRNDTLDSITIEDQEDDACKQLRKAKSFTSFAEQRMSQLMKQRAGKSSKDLGNVFTDSTPDASSSGRSPKKDSSSGNSYSKSASVDLLSASLVVPDHNDSYLKSYPASMDLASITNASSGNHASPSPPKTSSRLMPPIESQEPSSSRSRGSSTSKPRQTLASAAAKKLNKKVPQTYPTASQIQKAATTEDIAKFAESILQSENKRPIFVKKQEEEVYDPKKKHKCPLCLARFQRPEHVKRHLKSHSSEKPFQCEEPNCGRRFNRKDNLKAHLKKIHHKNL
ncbi:hypothetical protein CJI97_000766 [Candidozyma auris]|nr:hypothetical protein CJI97_000766 [[Candida] auris]